MGSVSGSGSGSSSPLLSPPSPEDLLLSGPGVLYDAVEPDFANMTIERLHQVSCLWFGNMSIDRLCRVS